MCGLAPPPRAYDTEDAVEAASTTACAAEVPPILLDRPRGHVAKCTGGRECAPNTSFLFDYVIPKAVDYVTERRSRRRFGVL